MTQQDQIDGEPSPGPSPAPNPMKRVAFASFVGTAIEYYDFYIYGTAAALIFPVVFFPNMGPTMATISSLATFAVAFLSRPIGAAVFGHFGDRFGRKKTLVATLLIMGSSTVGVGLVPSAESIGILAPVLLLTLRLLQGFAVGGEWAGSALLAAEYAPGGQRGRYGMFTQLGAGAGLACSNLVFLIASVTIGEKSPVFLQWGWRLPFLFSAVLVLVALYVRLTIDETPVFARELARDLERDPANKVTPRAPIGELLRTQTRQTLLAAGCMVGIFTMSFIGGTYLLSYASTRIGHHRSLVLAVGVLAGLSLMACTIISAILCDTYGRRRIILTGFGLALPWAFLVMPLIDTGSPVLFAVAISGTFCIFGISYGPIASFLPEIFATRYRYTGAGLSFNLAGIVGGAIPPLVAGVLVATLGSWAVGAMMAGFVVVSIVSTVLLPETKGAELDALGE
ncbi:MULTISPECIES: MFS transporter [unclassified Mycolicibacterium]|uniref:MFS transporter n=1 Tax=unclassified Mycolicibacterium TaxID=2636767 RepID=UPI0012DD83FE|nr:MULTISPECIES: MFS transporter [unclassified Mycolicibacterium]MUL84431.1 MHS family MFS transporter [Mycolicibacterium sp. CBMA 329]MUL88206.1 MHS family MFS transporter [Mycolicibacterium sp. CBMA 331]MUL99345.1 MHS family MFS transporter [Mycolicibacterium sp. CBMA 334]MUM27973.1 MHS family MFS transporter [Mycolicibacterium sp. CBMA 295]MUM39853.1 MHS family MFS transporter [Mycolicibacterium sp. CBMA 247]